MTEARWKATVFVGGLSPLVTNSHIHDAFIPFGEIVEVQLPKADSRNSTDPHRGFAYVEFQDPEDAKEAIDNMDQSELFGKILKVSQAKVPKSAGEGLGSDKAIWEQVLTLRNRLSLSVLLTEIYRKAGWLKMLAVIRTECRTDPRASRFPTEWTRCKVWRAWM